MEKKNILQPLPCTTEWESRIIQECMRESQRRAVQELLRRKTEPTMHNLDGFYSRIKEQESK